MTGVRRLSLAVVGVLGMPRLLAAEAVTLEGRVILAGGGLGAGARVELLAEPLRVPALATPEEARQASPPGHSVSADGEGWFTLVASSPGVWQARVEAPGRVPMATSWLPLVEDQVLPEVALPPDVGLEVTVTAGGRPLAGAGVWAEAARSDRVGARSGEVFWFAPRRAARTGEDGKARLPRAAGETLRVHVLAAGWAEAIADARADPPLRFELEAGSELLLRVRDAAGRPAPGTEIRLGLPGWPVGRTDGRGRIRVRLPAAGGKAPIQLRAADGAYLDTEVEAAAREGEAEPPPVTLRLLRPHALRGRVVVAGSGEPAPGALVWTWGEPGAFALTDVGGAYEIHWPAPALFWLQVAAGGHSGDGRMLRRTAGEAPTLAVWAAAAVSGEVADELGRPVSAAQVRAAPADELGSGRHSQPGPAYTNRRGEFRLARLGPRVPYGLRAVHPDFASAGGRVGTGEPGTTERVRLTLAAGGGARGRVVDAAGRPVAGGTLAARSEGQDDIRGWSRLQVAPARAMSAGDGTFVLDHLAPGRYLLAARAPGFGGLTHRFEIASPPHQVELGELRLEAGIEIAGRVVDSEGRPLPGARVGVWDALAELFAGGASEEPPQVVADREGRFRLPDRREGESLGLYATHDGHGRGRLTVTVPPPAPPVITLARLVTVSGRVVDPRGRGVPAAEVAWSSAPGPGFGRRGGPRTTGEDGGFRLEDVEPGSAWIGAAAAGSRVTQLAVTVPAAGLQGVELRLGPGAALTGRVLDRERRPVAGAGVSLGGESMRFAHHSLSDRTDGEGRYRLEGLTPGHVVLIASPGPGSGPATRAEARLEPGENEIDLLLPPGHEVSGSVLGPGGEPVAGASVSLRERGAFHVAVTGADGEFRFEGVPDGLYRAVAEAPGFGGSEAWQVAVDGAPVSGLELRLGKTAAVSGRVVGAAAAALVSARVHASRLLGETRSVPVDGDGRYRLDGLAPGEWSLSAAVPDHRQRAERVVLAADEERTLDLEVGSGFTLSGRIVRDSVTVGEARVLLSHELEDGSSGSSVRDSPGAFRFSGLEAGRYAVEATSGGELARAEVLLDGDQELLLELRPAGEVRGRVLATDGTPIQGARVSLEAEDPGADSRRARATVHHQTLTDSLGAFRVAGLREGGYRLRAQRLGFAEAERTLTLEGDREAVEAIVELEPAAGLTLEVVDAAGSPVSLVWVALRDAGGVSRTVEAHHADPEGRVLLLSVPAGSWQLLVRGPQTGAARAAVTVPSEPVRLRLPEAGALAIEVPALGADPVSARVQISDAGDAPVLIPENWGHLAEVWPVERGSARVRGLAPGRYGVRVFTGDGRSWLGWAEVPPGGEGRARLDGPGER